METLSQNPVECSYDAALTCKHLMQLSPERHVEVSSVFCEKIGLSVDFAPEDRAGLLAYILRAPDTRLTVGYVMVDSRKTGLIPIERVHGLREAMRLDGVENGIIFSLQPFSEEAKAFAGGKNIELIDTRNLYDNILILPEASIREIEETAYAIHYTAPICPRCKSVMDKAHNKVGLYWKCHNYPNCRQTFMW